MAYPNLVLPISVVDALKASIQRDGQPLYRMSGKTQQEDLNSIAPDGTTKTHIMSEIEYSDLVIFAEELDIALKLQDPIIQYLYAKNAVSLTQLIRGVNYNTRSGFKGFSGAGNALDAVQLRAEQFQNPDAAGVAARASWTRAIAAAGTLQFICAADALGANIHAALTAAANEGIAILGFANPAGGPCTSAFDLQYLGVNHNIQNLAFEMANTLYGDPVVELKQPLFIWPGETGLINVRYFQNGSDELRPIGVWIKTAANLRALATS